MPARPALSAIGWVFLGGSVGTLLRVAFASAFPVAPDQLPVTTLTENVVGAFLLAVLLTRLAARSGPATTVRLLVGTGVLGSFTTYGTLAIETASRAGGGAPLLALGYGVLSLLLGLLAAWIGVLVARPKRGPA